MCAAITSLAIAGAGVGLSAYQAAEAKKRERKAQAELNNYDRQELDNAFEDVPISMNGVNYQKDQSNINSANAVDALKQGGSRALIGGIPKISTANNAVTADIAKYMDDQYNRRAYAVAGDNARIEGITENRDNMNIGALGSQVQSAKQDFWSGIMGAASGAAYGARAYGMQPNPQVEAVTDNYSMPQQQPTSIPTQLPTATMPQQYPNAAIYPNILPGPAQSPSPYFNFFNSFTGQ